MKSQRKLTLLLVLSTVFGIQIGQNDAIFAQGSQRNLDDSTQRSSKFLTPGKADHWDFEGKKHETLYVDVSTNQFDPVLSLIHEKGGEEKVLVEVDDEGNTSRFRYRLPEKGKYRIRVNGFDMKGGGHYNLAIRRYRCAPVEFGKTIRGKFDHEGKAAYFFPGKLDENIVVAQSGGHRIQIFDENGSPVQYQWNPILNIKKDEEYIVDLRGNPDYAFELTIGKAQNSSLELGGTEQVESSENGLLVWNIQATPGQFRIVSISRHPDLQSRLIFSRKPELRNRHFRSERGYGELKFFPISSKGKTTRYAVLFGREGRFQLQAFSKSSVPIEVSMIDPTIPIERENALNHQLAIGGTQFYGFQANAGELLEAQLKSRQFDTVLRLYDQYGKLIAQNDDEESTLNSKLSHMINGNGVYRWQVSSLGDGGGGKFEMGFSNIDLKNLKLGQSAKSQLEARKTEYWQMSGTRGQLIYVNVKSKDFNPSVTIFGPDGNRVHYDNNSGIGTNSLAAIKLPKDGRYTIWVTSSRKSGDYAIRLLDASW